MVVKKNGLQLVCPPPLLCTDNGNHIFLILLLVVKANSINTVLLCKLKKFNVRTSEGCIRQTNIKKLPIFYYVVLYGLSAVLTWIQQLHRHLDILQNRHVLSHFLDTCG